MELSEKGRLVRALGERGLKSLLSGAGERVFRLCVVRNGAHRYGKVHTQKILRVKSGGTALLAS